MRAWLSPMLGDSDQRFDRSLAAARITIGIIFVLCTGVVVRAPLASDDYLYAQHPAARGFFWTDYRSFFEVHATGRYQPIGLLCLFGATPPDAWVPDACYRALVVAAWCVLFGFFTRVGLAVCVVCSILLFGLQYSYLGEWCHPPQGILLPAVALLAGPRSTRWSVDGLIDRYRGVAPEVIETARRHSRAPVLLAQFALAALFFNAALYKIYLTSGEPLRWAFSDNLRNLILLQHWKLGLEPSLPEQWIATRPWAYHGLALCNLITQLAVIGACFTVRRPRLRLAFGLVYLAEMIGLNLIMGICNPLWYPLVVLFVDWDWLCDRFVTTPRRAEAMPSRWAWSGRLQAGFVAAYLVFYVTVAFAHPRQRAWTFPFSAFPMYSGIFATRPYSEHAAYQQPTCEWQIDAEPPLSTAEQRRLSIRFFGLTANTPRAEAAIRDVRQEFEAAGRRVRAISLAQVFLIVPRVDDDGSAAEPDVGTTAQVYRLHGDRVERVDHLMVERSSSPVQTR
jgi:hypothetical protein